MFLFVLLIRKSELLIGLSIRGITNTPLAGLINYIMFQREVYFSSRDLHIQSGGEIASKEKKYYNFDENSKKSD